MRRICRRPTPAAHLNPYLFHAANVLLHAFTALIVFEILREIGFAVLARGWAR